MAKKLNLVMVGNGMAGARAVEEILARGGGEFFDITIFGDEPYGNYNRILLSNVLDGSQEERQIFLNPLEWYVENGIKLHRGVQADSILRRSKCVLGCDGTIEPYDKLIIATGSRSYIPPIEGLRLPDGSDKPGLFVFRTLDDCREIAEYARGRGRAAVIGGGLLGLEAASGLRHFGIQVDVIHRGSYLMGQQLDAQSGAIMKASIEKLGIGVRLGKNTVRIIGDEEVAGIEFKDGSVSEYGMVVISTGITPNAEIGARSGLTVERAIVVDDQMRSVDDRNVYVVGECAQHRGRLYGLVAPLWEQAKVLADHITGRNPAAAYHGSKVATKLKVAGVEMASLGVTEAEDERDEIVQFTEPEKRNVQKTDYSRRTPCGRHSVRRH